MERFTPLYDVRGELTPRDVVPHSIDDQLKTRNEGYVLLDISHKPKQGILSHFPNITTECLRHGLDITRDPILVVPAAHYMCGGVQVGLHSETSIMGLYVAGEVACTGLHDTNRLASNSLLEALVFAQKEVEPSLNHLAGSYIKIDESSEWLWPVVPLALGSLKLNQINEFITLTKRKLQKIIWDYVGIVRSTDHLKIAEKYLSDLELEWEDHLFQFGWRAHRTQICNMRMWKYTRIKNTTSS